ncbi:MAG: YgiT-type zinc finger protein [Deltaproteobacteria bacterium]|nr:YgiT-type zinc finger protein [Deltaproteobacteria bacterium]
MTELRRCPNCGSRRIERLARPFRARVAGKWVRIPNLVREICPDCHEEYFDRDANVEIDEACFGKQRRRA